MDTNRQTVFKVLEHPLGAELQSPRFQRPQIPNLQSFPFPLDLIEPGGVGAGRDRSVFNVTPADSVRTFLEQERPRLPIHLASDLRLFFAIDQKFEKIPSSLR